MRGLISEQGPDALAVAAPVRRAVPAVYQEDPLFLDLCAAFDDLIAPLWTAVDCFDAYLDPYLAPADFLPWLAALVGCQDSVERDHIAQAVRMHGRRGTAAGLREAAARAAGVPAERVEIDDPGGTEWSLVSGGVSGQSAATRRHGAARVRVPVSPDQDAEKTLAAVRAAVEAGAGVQCGVTVEAVVATAVVTGAETASPRRAQPRGARTYGGEES